MYRCYVCTAAVTAEEHEAGLGRLDSDEKLLDEVVDRYCLFHCRGDKDQFGPDDEAVVCPSCIDAAEKDIR